MTFLPPLLAYLEPTCLELAHEICMSLGEVLWDRVGCEGLEVLRPGL